MAIGEPLYVELVAKLAKYEAEMSQTARRVDASLALQERSIVRLESQMDKGFTRVGGSARRAELMVSSSVKAIGSAIAGLLTIQTAQKFLEIADEAKNLNATLNLATQGFGSLGTAQEDVRRIADDTRSGLSETASLYANFVRGAKELGGTQAEAARATETFSKSLKISGADANQAASATLQFGQALAAGALRGDELNSILEASPRLARLLAESMGQPIGQIKQLGEEGKLTSDKLLKALTDQKFTAGIDAEFNQLPVTFDDAMTRVYNAAVITFSAFDRGGEFSTMLANFFVDGADGFADLERSAEDFGISVRGTLEGLGSAFDPFVEAGREAFRLLGVDLSNFSMNGRKEIGEILGAFDDLLNIGPSIANFFGANGKYDSRLQETFLKKSGESDVQRRMSLIMAADPLRDAPPRQSNQRNRPTSASSSSKKTKTPRSPLNPEAFVREEAQLNDQILRLKADELVESADRAQVELQRIEASKQAALKDIANDDRYTGEQKAKVSALTETVAALEAAKVIHQQEVQAARDALEIKVGSLRNDQDLLRAQADLADTRDGRRDVELRLLDLAYQQERAELEGVLASEQATKVQKQIAQARLDVLSKMQGAETESINRQYESPLEQRRREVRQTAANMGDAIEQIDIDAVDRLADGLANASTEYIKLGGIAGDVINGIIQDLVRLAAKQALFGNNGGAGIIGSIGSFLGLGGSSSVGGISAEAQSWLDNYTPKGFATGGYTGDGPRNEVAGVVHRGEYVIPANAVDRIGIQNLAALTSGDTSAARAMTGVTAAGMGARPVQQTVVVKVEANDYFDARVDQRATQVAAPIGVAASAQARNAAGSDATRAARRRIPGR